VGGGLEARRGRTHGRTMPRRTTDYKDMGTGVFGGGGVWAAGQGIVDSLVALGDDGEVGHLGVRL